MPEIDFRSVGTLEKSIADSEHRAVLQPSAHPWEIVKIHSRNQNGIVEPHGKESICPF